MQAAVANPSKVRSESAAVGWQSTLAAVAAVLLGIVFLVSGGWKVLSPFRTGELLEQAQVPAGLGALGASVLGVLELTAASLLFTPRFRRVGGLLGSALILFFIGWIGYYYRVLVGHECSCFPMIKRSIGPGFFVGDGVMLLLGVVAYAWSQKILRVRIPLVILGSIALFAGASYGINRQVMVKAQIPIPVIVDGTPQDLTHGDVFLFFYDPSCMHCDAASKFMSKLNWGSTNLVAIPTINPQWAASFLKDTHLKAGTSFESEKLKKAFPFVDPPFGVALENGQVKQTFGQAQFNAPSPAPDLKRLGFVR